MRRGILDLDQTWRDERLESVRRVTHGFAPDQGINHMTINITNNLKGKSRQIYKNYTLKEI